MERKDLIVKILALWCDDDSFADEIDRRHSYTHASCGYQDAQSFVEDLLTSSDEVLETLLRRLSEPSV